ncbi:hypothetical protein MPSEU_000460500 [Mayamaea pseudoterrestris]|nr:hypothetical protein MPSEU_000460500 [Mayamaea pseudoterrestris]
MASIPTSYGDDGGDDESGALQQRSMVTEDHPLANVPNDFELAEKSSAAPAPLHASPSARAIQFPLPPPQTSTAGQQHATPHLVDSPTRTLDEFVDLFLLQDETMHTRLHPDPIPANISDHDKLELLVARRAFAEVVTLTHQLLHGAHSHYAPIWRTLLEGNEKGSLLALESQRMQLLQIATMHMHAMLKLQRFDELQKELASWKFARSFNDGPSWVPWSFRIAYATCLLYANDVNDGSNDGSLVVDVLHDLRDSIPAQDFISLLRVDQTICNYYCREKQWRMALASLQNMANHVSAACQQHDANDENDVNAVLALAHSCELWSRQGRVLLQAGATEAASSIFQQASSHWARLSSNAEPSLAQKHAIIGMVPAQLLMNEGLLSFANNKYEHALECFRRAAHHVKPMISQESNTPANVWSVESVLVTETSYALYGDCMNNMALCAIYTCRLHEAIHVMESLVRENPTAFLTERVALNLCTLYELQCDTSVAARKKRVLQLLAKRFTLHDVANECFRLQQ